MKIGFISFDHLRGWNGITRLIDRIAAEMAERGHSVSIVALEASADSKKKIPVSKLDYPHELITLNLNDRQGQTEAAGKIAASGLDVCAASIGSTRLLQLPYLFKSSGIPFIHGEPADPRVFNFARWQPYEHYGVLFAADAFTVLLEEYLPFYPKALQSRAHVIGNPAPKPAPVDFAARRKKKTRTIISAGRFNENDKRFSFLIRAFALLHKEFPEWRLKLAGSGTYREFYGILAEQLGIRRFLDFTGAVDDVGSLYEDSDIFCLPSFIAEGLPMVYLEASAYALPLAGYKSCVASAALIDSKTGALAEENTPESLANALRSLMVLPPEEREQTGINAHEKLQKLYGNSIVFDEWEALFAETVEKVKNIGSTALERSLKMNGIGKEWVDLNLTPDSSVWTKKVLSSAAAEISARENSMSATENSDTEAENVRLRCEIAKLTRDYRNLQENYASLAEQFKMLGQKRKK